LWGRRPELGKSEWCGSLRLRTADGQPLAHEDCPMAIAIREGKPIRGAEAALEKPDGTIIPFLAYPSLLRDAQGEVVGAINLMVDISRHKVAEVETHRLAAIVESSDDAIISKNLNGEITSWNGGAERIFGYTTEEALGKHVTMLIPEERQHEETIILGRVRSGERIDHFDTVRRRKNGSSVTISLTVSPIRNASGVIIGASKIARDITERKENEARIRLLMREVNHRVKNQFAVILSIVREIRKRATSPEAFEAQIQDRIMGLSRSHDLLVDGEWRGATLHDLVLNQVQPFAEKERVRMTGTPIILSINAVQNLGMAFHELATNSAKHGAFSNPHGTIDVAWTISDTADRQVSLSWTEKGGPTVGEVTRRGFGKVVLERVAPTSVGGVGETIYRPEGIVWTLDAPLSQISAASEVR
jgi:PAS domain S-box-containing protein